MNCHSTSTFLQAKAGSPQTKAKFDLRIACVNVSAQIQVEIREAMNAMQRDFEVVLLDGLESYKAEHELLPFDFVLLDPFGLEDALAEASCILDDPTVSTLLLADRETRFLRLMTTGRSVVAWFDGQHMSPSQVERVSRLLADPDELRSTKTAKEAVLSQRERQTLQYLGRGLSLKEAAYDLAISPKSVDTYKRRACAKLNLSSKSDMVEFVMSPMPLPATPAASGPHLAEIAPSTDARVQTRKPACLSASRHSEIRRERMKPTLRATRLPYGSRSPRDQEPAQSAVNRGV